MTIDIQKFEVRVLRVEDVPAIVDIDSKVSGRERNDYYKSKVAHALDPQGQIATSLVAEYDGKVIGFIMGNIYTGEFGIPGTTASLDTIGIDPEFAGGGVATRLFEDYMANLVGAGVDSIQTLVELDNLGLLTFFNKMGFGPSKTINFEKRI